MDVGSYFYIKTARYKYNFDTSCIRITQKQNLIQLLYSLAAELFIYLVI